MKKTKENLLKDFIHLHDFDTNLPVVIHKNAIGVIFGLQEYTRDSDGKTVPQRTRIDGFGQHGSCFLVKETADQVLNKLR